MRSQHTMFVAYELPHNICLYHHKTHLLNKSRDTFRMHVLYSMVDLTRAQFSQLLRDNRHKLIERRATTYR